jgi:ABC-2 type transport system ATP-binding protein
MLDDRPMIHVCNLHRYFGATRAVNDISFEVHRGEVFGYIGPNGAGKTTSMRIMATLDMPTHGDVFVDGFSVVEDADRVRRRLGYMPDAYGSYANVNVREYLDFFARAYGLRGKERLRAIAKTMAFTKLHELAEKPTAALSKGMKQRLCLGRAMIHDPAVLVMDEPAAGLDPRARIQFREMVRALAADGKAILISSHILTELGEMCDKVGIIELGKLLAVGTVKQIRRQQAGKNTVQIRVLGDPGPVAAWLAAREGVDEIRTDGDAVYYVHDRDREAEADVLRELVMAGFRVASFAGYEKTLEEVFMQVTEGKVQ